jgi:hypothetical protein
MWEKEKNNQMVGLNFCKKITASSLFETIVALMVIMVVFGIAMTIYVNIIRNSTSLAELKASQRLDEIARDTRDKKSYFDEKFEDEVSVIEKKVSKYQEKEGLLLLQLEVLDKNNTRLAERKEIIRDDTNE